MIKFPTELLKWLSNLPEDDRIRETMIAENNLRKIYNHVNK